ncbi:MAG: roadblock/LC7 domain-containing protein [Deltaproteobacteria bacterium]|jgi:predicted regulator of Ras-like GTPase activity (Roadblock/LC7/MglB family)|nr:roadblock/LC7 domain-containing protein [Deltaproteobacteria bacterium]
MSGPDVMFPEEQQQIAMVCQRLQRDANAKAVLLIGRDGQAIAEAGDVEELDVTSLSSLTAGNVAATGGISKILREKDFTSQFHEGEKIHVHITLVGGKAILVVLFDERSSLGLVRLRVKKSSDEMARLFEQVATKAKSKSQPSILTEITDKDIDNLFND